MSDQRTNVADDILDVIEMAIEKKLARLRNNFVRTTIVEMTSDNSLYIVNINGANYSVYSGTGIEFQVGDAVWVHVPDGDYKKAYICAAAFKRDIFQEITSSINMSVSDDVAKLLVNYPSSMYLQSNYMRTTDIQRMMNNYDTSDEVDNKLASYATTASVDDKLDNYYTSSEVDTKLNGYVENSDLDNYYTKTETNTKLNDYVTKTELQQDYDTSEEVDNKLSNYVTGTSLSETLSNYATLAALANVVAGEIGDLVIPGMYLGDAEPQNVNDKDVWISAAT